MKRSSTKHVLLIACTCAALGAGRDASAECSKETLKGAYGFSMSGTNYIRDVQWAIVGRFESDGAGTITGRGAQSAKGQISRTEFKGTYEVEADCSASGTLTFAQGATNLYLVIVDEGRRVEMLIVDPGTLEHGWATRIATDGNPRRTSAAR